MATDTRNLPAHVSATADFRAWGSGLSAQLAAMGLVKQADAGQIDWATVAAPAVGAFVAGQEIWRFNDAKQATKPVHIKLRFGIESNNGTKPKIAVQVGLGGTNGAGVLSGTQVSTEQELFAGGGYVPTVGTVVPSHASGAPNRLALYTNVVAGNPTPGFLFVVERLKKADDTETDEGVYTCAAGSNTAVSRYQPVFYAGAIPVAVNFVNALSPDSAYSAVGNAVFIAPHTIPFGEPRYAWPFSYKLTDLAELQSVTVAQFGADHIFLPVGKVGGSPGWTTGSVGVNAGVAIPWE